MSTSDRVAVIGVGALLPDALDIEALWSNLLNRRSALRPIPTEIWDPQHFYGHDTEEEDLSSSQLGGVVRGMRFDPREFNIPPSTEAALDITQKAGLLAARSALGQIGISGPTDGIPAAVIIGNATAGMQSRTEQVLGQSHRLLEATLEELPEFRTLRHGARQALKQQLRQSWRSQFPRINSNSLSGALGNIIAARIAQYFNFYGPTQTIDAACASSLAALDIAASGLLAHRYDLALSGGIDFCMDCVAYIGFSRMSALSDTGSYPFDVRASGFVMGEGAVLFALKRLSDAQRDGDHIYAIVESIGAASDGRGTSIVAPNPTGQLRALRSAYASAGVSPRQVGYFEAHGTATAIGDPIEIQAMSEAFADCPPQSVALGSIKANIGHLKSAAGAAGLLRAMLAMDRGVVPPQANFEMPNPRCRLDRSPCRVPLEPEDWPADKTHAGVSSFGFGGINYHCLLRRSPDAAHRSALARRPAITTPGLGARDYGVVAVGAASHAELLRRMREAVSRLEGGDSLSSLLHDDCEPQDAPVRLAFHAFDTTTALEKLRLTLEALQGEGSRERLARRGIHFSDSPAASPASVAWMFPGQGSQYVGMLGALRSQFAVIQETFRQADHILRGEFDRPLTSYLSATPLPAGEPSPDRFQELSQTHLLQPLMITCNEALRRTLQLFCKPGLVMGHSLGDISACIAAGTMTFEAGLRLAARRGRLAQEAGQLESAGLLQVALSPRELEDRLASQVSGPLTVASYNCPSQTVVGGAASQLEAFQKLLESQQVKCSRLAVSQAFHTPLMRGCIEPLRAHLEQMALEPPKVTLLSSMTAGSAPLDASAADWLVNTLSRQMSVPVRFIETVQHAYAKGARIFIEVGPKQALCGLTRQILSGREKEVLACCLPKTGEAESFGDVLAALVAHGLIPGGTRAQHPPVHGKVVPRAPQVRRVNGATGEPAASRSAQTRIGTLDWMLRRLASWLDCSVEALSPEADLESERGINAWRQHDFRDQLLAELGSTVPADRPRHVPFPNLLALFESLTSGNAALSSKPESRPPSTPAAAAAALAPAESSTPVIERVLTLVMARTGYKREELPLDAHLEEVLGVDSIAQLEVVAELLDQLGLPVDASFRVSNYPTLRSMAAYVEDHLPKAAAMRVARATTAKGQNSLVAPFYLRKLVLEQLNAQFEELDRGQVLVLHDGSAPGLLSRMRADRACNVSRVSDAELRAQLGIDFDRIVILASPPQEPLATPLAAAKEAVRQVSRVGRQLLSAAGEARDVLVVVEAIDPSTLSQRSGWAGAHVAAWKSLFREWQAQDAHPSTPASLRVIEAATALDANADAIADNLNRRGPFELRLGADAAWYSPVLRDIQDFAPVASVSSPPVVLITGGARGIMALIAKALYRKTRCTLVLVGRTPPAEATHEVGKHSHEVSQTLLSLREAGAQVAYLVADLTRESEVIRVRDQIIGQFGHLDWIVHGAGVDSSAPLRSKSEDHMEGVLATKLTALQLLSAAADSAAVFASRSIGISSVAARFGNAGQLEYAAANEALARTLTAHGGLVIASGPWRDIGMAASLTHLLRQRNIDTLPSQATAEAIAELIASGATGEHVIAGRLGRSEVPLAGMAAHLDQDVPEAFAVQTLRLDYEQLAWLRDHTLRDAGLLPAVVSLALMCELAQSIQPGTRGLRVESFVLRKAVIIRRGRVGTVEVRAERGPCIQTGVPVQVGIHHGSQAAHCATIVLGPGETAPPVRLQPESTRRRRLTRETIYATAFHGQTFRVLDTVELFANHARGRSIRLEPPLGADLSESIRYVAMAREVALQTVGVWLGAECEEMALPESLERLSVFAQPRSGEVVTATIEANLADSGERFFNVLLTGEDERVLEQIEGVRFKRTGSSKPGENATVPAWALETEADEALG